MEHNGDNERIPESTVELAVEVSALKREMAGFRRERVEQSERLDAELASIKGDLKKIAEQSSRVESRSGHVSWATVGIVSAIVASFLTIAVTIALNRMGAAERKTSDLQTQLSGEISEVEIKATAARDDLESRLNTAIDSLTTRTNESIAVLTKEIEDAIKNLDTVLQREMGLNDRRLEDEARRQREYTDERAKRNESEVMALRVWKDEMFAESRAEVRRLQDEVLRLMFQLATKNGKEIEQ